MLLSQFIREGAASLEALYPPREARSLILMLCSERLGVKDYTHIIEPLTDISPNDLQLLRTDLERLLSGEPIQYVLGFGEFLGRRFNVGPGVLIPRPETELLVIEAVRKLLTGGGRPRVLDLCTGSGCIAWSIALEVPGAQVTAVDISPEALSYARRQFPSESAPTFIQADILADGCCAGEEFDAIVSNPPYIMESEKAGMRSNVLDHEPPLALFVPDGDPLLFYRAIAGMAAGLLAPGGFGMVEINEGLGPGTAEIFRLSGLKNVKIGKDLAGKDRFVSFEKQAAGPGTCLPE